MSFPYYIAKRYLFSKSSNNAINIITKVAGAGVIIGSASLFIVLSGFAGLKDFSIQFSSLIDPDLKVIAANGKTFELLPSDLKKLNEIDEIASFSQIVEDRVVMNSENKNLIVALKGVDQNYPTSSIDSIIVQGNWMEPGYDQLVSGWGISTNLSFSVFDFGKTIKLYVPKPGKGQITSVEGAYNTINAVNSGIFQINETLDNSVVFANIDMVKRLLNYSDTQITGVEIILHNPEQIAVVTEKLASIFEDKVVIKNKIQLNDALYKMLNTENMAVYLIFTLVLIIALFNVIGSIIMMILDKRTNLTTLFNMGVTVKEIRKIFFIQGSLMSMIGGVIGLGLGILLIWLQKVFSLVMLTPSLPYPVSLRPINVLIVILTISILGILASKVATARISKQLVNAS